MQSTQILGMIGAALVLIGVFVPVISVPIWGSINLFQIHDTLAVALLLLAAVHLFLCINKVWWGLYLTKAGVFAAFIYAIYRNWEPLTGHTSLVGSIVKQVTKVHWGTGILAAGIIILLSVSIPKPVRKIVQENNMEQQ